MWRQTPEGRVEHAFEPLMLGLTLLVIPVVLIEETTTPQWLKTAATAANWVIWAGFTLELALVLVVAPRKRAALRAHWLEAAIVLLTPPFLPGLVSALRIARLVRLVRLLRLGLLGSRALRAERVLTSREGFRYVALATGLLVVVAGAAISTVDTEDFPNVWLGMWWAMTTVTTVGYGDVVPHSPGGRVVASALMIVGIGFISLLTATVASSFVSRDASGEDEDRESEHEQVMRALARIEERLAVLETNTR